MMRSDRSIKYYKKVLSEDLTTQWNPPSPSSDLLNLINELSPQRPVLRCFVLFRYLPAFAEFFGGRSEKKKQDTSEARNGAEQKIKDDENPPFT